MEERDLKSIVLIVLVAFLVVSFGFLDGWPFRSDRAGATAAEDMSRDEGLVAPGQVDPEPASAAAATIDAEAADRAEQEAVMAVREALAAARDQDLETRLRALSAADACGEALEELRQVVQDQVLRGARGLGAETVAVASGDNLTRIAHRVQKKHGGNVSPALVMKINGLRNDRIRVGQKLVVPTGRLEVLISKSDHRLYLVLDGIVVQDFPIGIGRDDSTPEGRFSIVNKTIKPTWRNPDGRLLEYGHPDHIIGTRWMGFADERGATSYGIHGTTEPESIGKDESDGCIRMLEADVEEVFRLVPEGCPVRVLP